MSQSTCPFCSVDAERPILAENELALAIADRFPVSPGHTLVIPRRHVADYFALTPEEKKACWSLIDLVQEQLLRDYAPDGFNIGINVGEAAGQTVFHVHIHLIPRYTGDVDKPRGGVRGVIPGKKEY